MALKLKRKPPGSCLNMIRWNEYVGIRYFWTLPNGRGNDQEEGKRSSALRFGYTIADKLVDRKCLGRSSTEIDGISNVLISNEVV